MRPDKKLENGSAERPENPIFIVGAPRSGTSLLRVLLNRHPAIGLCDETYFFYYVYNRQKAFGDLRKMENRRLIVERYLETERVRRLGLDLDSLSEHLLKEAADYKKLFITFLKFYAASKGKQRYGEKTPAHAFEAETLSRIFPGCRLIHIVRDPRDVVASLKRMPWGSPSVAANARLWTESVKAAERCKDNDNFLRVIYRSLASEPETELRRICEFISEPFDEKMLEAEDTGKKDLEWWFQRARTAIDTSRIEKWREQLSAEEVAVVEWIAGETMRGIGYETAAETPTAFQKAAALADEGLTKLRAKITGLPRLWYHWARPKRLAAEEALIDNYGTESEDD